MKFLVLMLLLVAISPPCSGKNTFTDKDLQKYLANNPKGIIYLVSPHMYLSVKGLEEYKKIAINKKLPFLVLTDPMATKNKNILNVDLNAYPKLGSREIASRDATHHYPSYIFYKNGKLNGRFIPGYDPIEKFEKRLREFFDE